MAQWSVVYLGIRGPLANAKPGRLLYGSDEAWARAEAGTAGRVQTRDRDDQTWRDAPAVAAVGRG